MDTRIWRRDDGGFAHHLLDPSTGEPAWTGLVGVTALGRDALEAETLSKAALLSGPESARPLLAERGGMLVDETGSVELVGPVSAKLIGRRSLSVPQGPTPVAGVPTMSSALAQHIWWLVSRASGVVALGLVTVSVVLGLTWPESSRAGPVLDGP